MRTKTPKKILLWMVLTILCSISLLPAQDKVPVNENRAGSFSSDQSYVDAATLNPEDVSPVITLAKETPTYVDTSYWHPLNENITISARIVSQYGVEIDSAKLYWRQLGQTRYFETIMLESEPDMWEATIPDLAVRYKQIQFYIWAADDRSINTAPVNSKENPYKINVLSTAEGIRPAFIQLTDATYELTTYHHPSNRAVEISVRVVDDMGDRLESVWLSHRIVDEPDYKHVAMNMGANNLWTQYIGADNVLQDGVQFYVTAYFDNKDIYAPSTFDEETDNPFLISILHVNKGPTIDRTAETKAYSESPQFRRQPIQINAYIVDDVEPGLDSAVVFYKHEYDQRYQRAEMENISDSLFSTRMNPDYVYPPGVQYYIYATDSKLQTYDPDSVDLGAQPYYIHIDTTLYNEPPVIQRTSETRALSDVPQRYGSSLHIAATITDTVGVPFVEAKLFYRFCSEDTFTSVFMQDSLEIIWWYDIPDTVAKDPCVEYYITAWDDRDSSYSAAGSPPEQFPHIIHVKPYNPPPVIDHLPISYHPPDSTMAVSAAVYDSTNFVDSVFVYYRDHRDTSTFKKRQMARYEADHYAYDIPRDDVTKPYIEYYIWAIDDENNFSETSIYRTSTFLTAVAFSVYPNPFTPNNDGYNDYVLYDIEELRQGRGSVVIYNQRGRRVREVTNTDKWYGRDDDGNELPPGIYIYAITIDGDVRHSDTLTLIR